MVFKCNHCGESLKKPTVKKHYTLKSCKNETPFLTCVDCLKDFRGDEFRAHTKCIAKDEKTSPAKIFVAKAEKNNKNAQKQEAWTEIIQAHLTQHKDLDTHTKQTLERIACQTNVPRKKVKFINYIRNSLHISPNSAPKIWSVVEAALEEFTKKEDAAKAEAAAARKIVDDERAAAKKAKAEAAGESGVKAKKKKEKKPKKSADGENEVTSTTEETEQTTTEEVTTKKKKKDKKRKLEKNDAELSTSKAGAKKAKCSDEAENGSASFAWKKEITAVLTKKNNIKLEKLRTKVLKRLAETTGSAETTSKDEKKFQKHLDKLGKFVSVEGEKVKLLVTE